MTDLNLLTAALAAAEQGWPVFPLHPGQKRPALHAEFRCPRTGPCRDGHVKWEQRATVDPERIRRCWSTAAFNVGIATGPAGLVVIDLDVPKPAPEGHPSPRSATSATSATAQVRDVFSVADPAAVADEMRYRTPEQEKEDMPDGMTTFRALCERAGQPFPLTRQVRTPSGGAHLYFVAPPGVRLTSTARKLGPGIDSRSWGGCVVAPGSRTSAGSYEVVDGRSAAELPAWLRAALRPTPAPRPVSGPVMPRHGTRYARAALDRETEAVATAPKGERERRLFEAARAMGRFIAWGDLDRQEVEEAFQAGGEAAGLPASQCRATLRSALNWSIRTARPRETT
ncbi:bifunctional DNA primase/polymerase [Streptomyces huiliensis]|uniref:bifunctional DNA primase/polymerase n=1 Tax=Streptomyces huiliensis TaxID=2876027 RepID=UPI001CBF803E|nr:bifunctional DNA primase/polymerase [Streptomyces huiliensis]MBZ4319412.1 bifunctional DNA primase/polymerase [Streptomyces huiliensis]